MQTQTQTHDDPALGQEIVAPQLGAPEGTQAEIDSAQAEAAKKKPRVLHECRLCNKKDESVKYLVLVDGDPMRQLDGSWSFWHGGCAHTVRKAAPEGTKVEVVSAFEYRRRKSGGGGGGKPANLEEAASGLWKTLARGTGRAEFPPKGGDLKGLSPMASAFAKANGGKPVDPTSFGKPEKAGKRDKKSRRHEPRDDE